jgi:hypothetical protein
MTGGWVAGTVRAKAMARRVLGAEGARQLAACQSLPEAQRLLAATPYRAAERSAFRRSAGSWRSGSPRRPWSSSRH